MTSTTTDGKYKLTTVEQEGPETGEEMGRVWILHQNTKGASRTRWILPSGASAAEVVRKAGTQTAEEFDAWYELQNTGANVHVTAIRKGGVYGHPDSRCDEGGCAAGTELFFSQVDASDVEVGNVYEIDETGKVLFQVEV
jgi:hypothetical protein